MWLTEGCQEPQLRAGDSPLLPQVNSEYYTGWLDYWGEAHASTSSALVARGLKDMLQLGASVNMQVVSWWGVQPGETMSSALPASEQASLLAFVPQDSGRGRQAGLGLQVQQGGGSAR